MAVISAVSTIKKANGVKLLTLSVTPTAIGNSWCLCFGQGISTTNHPDLTSITGGGVPASGVGMWARLGTGPIDASTSTRIDMWFGTIKTLGTSTITVVLTNGTQSSAQTNGIACQEFTAGNVATIWTVDTANNRTNTSSTNVTYPSLTPAAANRLYFGYGYVANTAATTGQTAGYTAQLDSANNSIIHNPNVAVSAQAPVATQSPAGVSTTLGALVIATIPDNSGAWFPFAVPGHHEEHDELAVRRRLHVPHRSRRALLRKAA